jgi:hypothetical protein
MRNAHAPWTIAACAGAVALACGTNAPDSGGDQNLPNAKAGPFRELRTGEMRKGQIVPWAVRKKGVRDPSALDADANPATLGVVLYAAIGADSSADGEPTKILRYEASDGRAFELGDPAPKPETVLEATETWEGGVVGAPSALRVGAEVWLYYAGATGIGLATSPDGVTFTKRPGPVLGAAASPSWEAGFVPEDPSVVRLPDGSWRMFYAAAGSIGEAKSADGLTWARVSGAPVLSPVAAPSFPAPDADTVDEPPDDVAVTGPCAVTAVSALGRPIVRVYYAGHNRIGLWSLGLAARYGSDGVLQRATGPVLGNLMSPRGPAVLSFTDVLLVWYTASEDKGKPAGRRTIAMGVAPATASLAVGE